jgi:Leu/Phe-tRNA-protein transferase
VIVLHEAGRNSSELLEVSLVKTLEKESTGVAEDFRLNNQHIGDFGTNDIHESEYLFL